MTIWEIEDEILNCIDTETGEILDEEKIESLEMARNTKIENTALWYKNLKAEAKALREESQALAKRARTNENLMESLENYLKYVLDGEKFSTSKVKIYYRRSEAVEVDDVSKLEQRFLKYAEPTANKTEIKRAIEKGEQVDGARIVSRQNMIVG